MTKHNNDVYLQHIVDSIEKIDCYIGDFSFDQFMKDDQLIDAVIRNIEIIGEASNKIPDNFKKDYQEIDFKPATNMRNRLIHGYDDINFDFIWTTIKEDLPKLKKQIAELLENN